MMRQKTYVLAKAILERKDILFGASSENVFKPQVLKEKEDAWEAVRLEMIDQGFANFERKSWRDVRNHDWQYLRRSAVAKYEHNQKLGVEPLPYSDVDKVVFEIMGNEVPSSSSQYDFINGAIAASFNFLKSEDLGLDTCNNNNNGADSFLVSPNPNASHAAESSFNTDQQQISTILNNALAASASMLNRKMSWETNSPTGSPQQQTQKGPQSNGCNLQQMPATLNEIVDVNAEKNKVTANTNGRIICQSTPNAAFFQSLNVATASNANQGQNVVEQAKPSVSSGIITSSTSQSPSRKRVHSSSSIAGRSTEEEIQEAKLQLLLLQVKREELLIKQENSKLLQEEAKARQEQIKAELLERQLN